MLITKHAQKAKAVTNNLGWSKQIQQSSETRNFQMYANQCLLRAFKRARHGARPWRVKEENQQRLSLREPTAHEGRQMCPSILKAQLLADLLRRPRKGLLPQTRGIRSLLSHRPAKSQRLQDATLPRGAWGEHSHGATASSWWGLGRVSQHPALV